MIEGSIPGLAAGVFAMMERDLGVEMITEVPWTRGERRIVGLIGNIGWA